MKPIIKVEGLSKLYHIGSRPLEMTLRERLTEAARAPLRRFRRDARPEGDALWALKDVSFTVEHGEVVGILGRNGAGKSTLLKVLSRVVEPTAGRVQLYGRVGSLLEVGTGFHPELTGRENIFLNGSILGMGRREIEAKFDQIVAFAEVERFIDMPVKHYSSGMYVRLAFSVAAHLEPEILIVDEVLSVGDAAFQQKCLAKIRSLVEEGRTVLFVSHNLGSVANICTRAILLEQGQIQGDGAPADVVADYTESVIEYMSKGEDNSGEVVWPDWRIAPGNANVRLHAVRVVSDGETAPEVDIDKEVSVEVDFWVLKPGPKISVSIHLLEHLGTCVLASANYHSANLLRDEWFDRPHPVGLYRSTCRLPANFLNAGRYGINAMVMTDVSHMEVFAREVTSFMVRDTGAMRKEYEGQWIGAVRPRLAWQSEQLADELKPAGREPVGEKVW